MFNGQQTISELPVPDQEALQLSSELVESIKQEITDTGVISFSRFMQRALYEPAYGYYMNGLDKFGSAGDFVTAPEVSPLFSRCLALQCAQLLNDVPSASILELGAGSGVMAVEVLLQLQTQGVIPERYYILELSGSLRHRQQQAMAILPDELKSRVEWLDTLEGLSFSGIILANEVLDALPVERFVIQSGEVMALAVDWCEEQHALVYKSVTASEELKKIVQDIEKQLGRPFTEGYCSEVNLQVSSWLQSISECLLQGVMLAIDYGYSRSEYYHLQRNMGTLICHYKHRAHDNVLDWIGLQDITAQVDFTAVAESATACGLNVAGFSHQAAFLIDCGIEQLFAKMSSTNAAEQLIVAQQLKTLLLPTEMGERFKVMALTKEYNKSLLGFGVANDLRHHL